MQTAYRLSGESLSKKSKEVESRALRTKLTGYISMGNANVLRPGKIKFHHYSEPIGCFTVTRGKYAEAFGSPVVSGAIERSI